MTNETVEGLRAECRRRSSRRLVGVRSKLSSLMDAADVGRRDHDVLESVVDADDHH